MRQHNEIIICLTCAQWFLSIEYDTQLVTLDLHVASSTF